MAAKDEEAGAAGGRCRCCTNTKSFPDTGLHVLEKGTAASQSHFQPSRWSCWSTIKSPGMPSRLTPSLCYDSTPIAALIVICSVSGTCVRVRTRKHNPPATKFVLTSNMKLVGMDCPGIVLLPYL